MSKHGLSFFIEGAEISVDEMGAWASSICNFDSEKSMEDFAHDATHAILNGVTKKVREAQMRESRAAWVQRNPPNHAGFYYCHICGGWVHQDEAELDHVVPFSVKIGNPDSDDNRRMAHTWPQYDAKGKVICIGNKGKGSRRVESKTMDIRPPDTEI